MPFPLDLAAAEDRVHDLLGQSKRRELHAFVLQVLEDRLKADTQLLSLGTLANMDSDYAPLLVVDRPAGGAGEGNGFVAEETGKFGHNGVSRNVALGKLQDLAPRMLDYENTSPRGRIGAAAVVPAADTV